MNVWLQPEPQNWWMTVEDALAEDVGSGDVSAGALPHDLIVKWRIEVQADGILCGAGIAEHLLAPYPTDPERCDIELFRSDGEFVKRGDIIMQGECLGRRAMMVERTALNFLMHLSGIATLTDKFVKRVDGTGARIVDTRKTLPMLRTLQKYAVRCGGGHNHRMGLYDGAMLKDNHIQAAGGIRPAVDALRTYLSHMTKIEVECERIAQVDEAVAAGADVILLDNMDPFDMREAVRKHQNKCLFEASGGINLDTVRGVAQTGVDLISVGMLTHSAPALPLHMEIS